MVFSGMVSPLFGDLSERKARLKILILGPYRPADPTESTACMERLVALKAYLNSFGYDNAKLVSDFSDVPRWHEKDAAHFEVKSKQMILEWAIGLLFVFLRGCDNSGVGGELTFVDAKRPDLFHSSKILQEESTDISTIIRGPLNRHGIEADRFQTDEELHELAVGACMAILYRNYWRI